MSATPESCMLGHARCLWYLFVYVIFFLQSWSAWTPLWVQPRYVRSLLTTSAAMSTSTSTPRLPSPWTTPRCYLPMLAWTRWTSLAPPLLSELALDYRITCLLLLSLNYHTHVEKSIWFIFCTFSLSSSPSSSTPSIHLTPWQSCIEQPTLRSVSEQEGNTTTWMMWGKMSTIIPSLRCLGPGPLGTTSRYLSTFSVSLLFNSNVTWHLRFLAAS